MTAMAVLEVKGPNLSWAIMAMRLGSLDIASVMDRVMI
jgi:hypothetical protein